MHNTEDGNTGFEGDSAATMERASSGTGPGPPLGVAFDEPTRPSKSGRTERFKKLQQVHFAFFEGLD